MRARSGRACAGVHARLCARTGLVCVLACAHACVRVCARVCAYGVRVCPYGVRVCARTGCGYGVRVQTFGAAVPLFESQSGRAGAPLRRRGGVHGKGTGSAWAGLRLSLGSRV